jgi:hypothetical protein
VTSRLSDISSDGTDSGIASIAAGFGIGLAIGDQATGNALAAAGMGRRKPCPPVFPFPLPPGILTGTAVGTFLDSPDKFGPPTGWFWDITSITLSGFTAGSVAVTRNAPAVDSAGNPVAIEFVTSFAAATTVAFPQKGNPLLDGNDRLVFTVTATLTGQVRITGTVIAVPVSRIDEYLS